MTTTPAVPWRGMETDRRVRSRMAGKEEYEYVEPRYIVTQLFPKDHLRENPQYGSMVGYAEGALAMYRDYHMQKLPPDELPLWDHINDTFQIYGKRTLRSYEVRGDAEVQVLQTIDSPEALVQKLRRFYDRHQAQYAEASYALEKGNDKLISKLPVLHIVVDDEDGHRPAAPRASSNRYAATRPERRHEPRREHSGRFHPSSTSTNAEFADDMARRRIRRMYQ